MRRQLSTLLLLVLAALALRPSGAVAAPGISLTLVAQPSTAPAGEQVLYTFTVTNSSDRDVAGMVASVTLPDGFEYVSGSALLSLNGTRLPDQEPALVAGTLTWHRLSLPARATSGYGMHTFIQDACSDDHIDYQLDRVVDVAGSGAYVKQLLYGITAATSGPKGCWVHFVDAAYDRGLIPVLRLQGEFGASNWVKPQPDPGGGYATLAAAYKRVVAGLPRRDGKPLYIEVWNEPNLGLEWSGAANPTEYARFLVDVSASIRSLGDPRIVILNGALSPGGHLETDCDRLAFIDAMAAVPGALQAFDAWAAHPYPGNQPPEYNLHSGNARNANLAIDSYMLELDRLAAHGRSGLRVLLTETGYYLGACDLCALGFPQIDEHVRADYIARALRDYWSRWPEVIGVCPFELVDPYGNWAVWDWLYPDGRHHAQFDAVAGLQKPAPAPSSLTISFRARVWAEPGTYTSAASAVSAGETLAVAAGLAPVSVRAGEPLPTPQPPPPVDPGAIQLLRNLSFEADSDWDLIIAGRGGYSTAYAHSGARSYRLGLPPDCPNTYAFSSVEQAASSPAYPGTSVLSFWYRPVSTDATGDYFKVLVRDAASAYHTLGYLRLDVPGWTYASFDTTGYGAEALRLTVVNDGYGGETSVFVDDVSWALSPLDQRLFLPLALRGGAASMQASEVAVEPAPVVVGPLAASDAALPAEAGAVQAVAVSPESGQAYAATQEGLWRFDPAGAEPPVLLRAGHGYRALLVDPDGGRLWVSDWEAGAVLALDPANGRELARSGRLLQPSGLVAHGNKLFVAETGAARIVVLDRRTCGIMKDELVGSAPYALAVDATRERIWVANAGGRTVTVLDARTGVPVGSVSLGGLGHPQGVAVDSLRGRAYVTYLLTPRYHALAVIDAISLDIVQVLRGCEQTPLLGAYGVAVEPETGRIMLSDIAGLLSIHPSSLAVEAIVPGPGFTPAFGFAVGGLKGQVLAAGSNGPGVRVLQRQE